MFNFNEEFEYKKIAVADIGANSVRMNIYDVNIQTGEFTIVHNSRSILGLAGYRKNNCLTKDGDGKLLTVLREFLAISNSIPVDMFVSFATASLRGLANSKEILDRIYNELGIKIEIISGIREANLDRTAIRERFETSQVSSSCVLDMGGGSTELSLFTGNKNGPSVSLPIGSLALSKKYFKVPLYPTKEELDKLNKYVNAVLNHNFKFKKSANTIYIIGGTGRAIARTALFLDDDKDKTTDSRVILSAKYLGAAKALSTGKNHDKLILKSCPDRKDSIIAGASAMQCIIKYIGAEKIVISSAGVREGYLSDLIQTMRNENETNK
jgi:exopolyphosphatase/guanosine-5'-triphosphate,3'-diphosphate pyrophosphatase